jgi:glutamyl-tRNA reductase
MVLAGGAKMGLIMVGLSHKTASLDLRETLALEGQRMEGAYAELKAGAFDELLLLSTCNRVEAYASCESAEEGEKKLRAWIEALSPERSAQVKKSLISAHEDEALWHLMQVAASLDSMVLGESQILGQVKQAYAQAVENRAVGAFFHGLFQRVFSAVKEVRTHTDLGRHPSSVPSVAVKLAERLFGELSGKCALLVGAGDMAELCAEYLKSAGIARLIVCNRSLPKARELAKKFHAEALGLDELETALKAADVAVFSTASPEPLLDWAMAGRVFEARHRAPQLLVDIAVPRNIAPEVKGLEPAYLYNIDDLSQLAEEHHEKRLEASREAKSMLRKRYYEIREWIGSERVTPTIKALTARVEALRKAEWEKQSAKLSHLQPADLERVEYMTEALVKKILNMPIARLKGSLKDGHVARHVESLETLFDLKDEA